MGKEITSTSHPSHKKEMVAESIRRGVDYYLQENLDKLGFVSVQLITISEDLRSATVYISSLSSSDAEAIVGTLNKDKIRVSEKIKHVMSTRFFPKLYFKRGNDENMVL